MLLTEAELLTGLAAVIWPFCRVSGFCLTLFVLSGNTVPVMVRLMFALVFTACVLPQVPAVPAAPALFSVGGLLITVKEVLIGVAIGYATQFLAQVFAIAGQTVAMQTGLGFASLVDPVSGTNAPVVGQFFVVLTTLVFFTVNGHLLFIRLLVESFTTVPVDGGFLPLAGLHDMFYFMSVVFFSGAAMAISSICTMLVINFTLGFMTKAAPQLNIFSLGFAISMTTGLVVLTATLNAYMSNFYSAFNSLLVMSCTLIGTGCEGPF